jgi:hypothetical protein
MRQRSGHGRIQTWGSGSEPKIYSDEDQDILKSRNRKKWSRSATQWRGASRILAAVASTVL